jgi:acyl-CoA synthetase (AMP-forming)/AMP-acid ligase II
VDATLLAHPLIGEAVSFAAPDEKYGEDVAAAVVLNGDGEKALEEDQDKDKIILSIKDFCKEKLAAFKVPKQIFITDNLPKNATGKIQRRFMVDAFITNKKSE